MSALRISVAAALCGSVWSAPTSIESQSAPKCIYTPEWEPRNSPSIMMPVYVTGSIDEHGNCNDHMFLAAAKGCRSVVAILNPNTGPRLDATETKTFHACVRMLEENNVRMVGYVFTKLSYQSPKNGHWTTFGMRPQWEVREDLDTWHRMMKGYSLFKGIFFDNVSSYHQIERIHMMYGVDQALWYRELITYSKQTVPGLVVLNPGEFTSLKLVVADPENGFPEPADIVVNVEESASVWSPPGGAEGCLAELWDSNYGTYGPGPWCTIVPNHDGAEPYMKLTKEGKIGAAAIINDANLDFTFTQGAVALKNGFKYLYTTNLSFNDYPYQQVPKFWEAYLYFIEINECDR